MTQTSNQTGNQGNEAALPDSREKPRTHIHTCVDYKTIPPISFLLPPFSHLPSRDDVLLPLPFHLLPLGCKFYDSFLFQDPFDILRAGFYGGRYQGRVGREGATHKMNPLGPESEPDPCPLQQHYHRGLSTLIFWPRPRVCWIWLPTALPDPVQWGCVGNLKLAVVGAFKLRQWQMLPIRAFLLESRWLNICQHIEGPHPRKACWSKADLEMNLI